MRGILKQYHQERGPILACAAISFILAWLISKVSLTAGLTVLGVVFALLIVLLIFNNYRAGFLLLILYSFCMFEVYRLTPPSVPYFPLGVFIEIMLVLLLISILVNRGPRHRLHVSPFQNPIGFAVLIYTFYSLVLLFHPQSRAVVGRLLALRETLTFLVLFFVCAKVFQDQLYIYRFARFWIALALIAGLYGIYQEIFGLQDWELQWLYSQPDQGRLAIVWGHIRKWSFLSDINAFGLLMAYGGIVCGILSLGPFTLQKKIFLAAGSFIMFVAMTFSGTRTATVMAVCGLAFYVLITLNQRRSIILALGMCFSVTALFVGPFYGPNFNRLRSTFQFATDPSMGVRDNTRARMQPYVLSHPFGGGINTTGALGTKYDPHHELAGNWDPDSGYLKTALERGWVGLAMQLGLYATIVIYSLLFFYRTADPIAAALCSAYVCGFFALTVANYAQDSLEQKPINLIVMASIASILSLSAHNKPSIS